MKLTHRDFRPLRRSKYVAQPLKRRPTLRIVALTAVGIAVYLKFDSVVDSKIFQNLRQPRKLVEAMLHKGPVAAAVSPSAGLTWSADSAQVEAECSDSLIANCLYRWQSSLGAETIGALRGVLAKASMQLEVNADHGFNAHFIPAIETADPQEGPVASLILSRLEISGGSETLVLERPPGNTSAPFCDKRKCLDANPLRMPVARFRVKVKMDPAGTESRLAAGTTLSLIPIDGSNVNPILRGRVVEAPSNPGPDRWVKIYHGADIFSYYGGLSDLGPTIKPGTMIEAGETLGQVAAAGDSSGILDVRIEKGGVFIDPFEFLGVAPQAVATAPEPEILHVR